MIFKLRFWQKKKHLSRIHALEMRFLRLFKAAHKRTDSTTNIFNIQHLQGCDQIAVNKEIYCSSDLGFQMAGCLRKFGNTSQRIIRSTGEVNVFSLEPEQAIRLFSDGRKRRTNFWAEWSLLLKFLTAKKFWQ